MKNLILFYSIGLLIGLPFVYLENKFTDPTGNFHLLAGLFLFSCIHLVILIIASAIINFRKNHLEHGFIIQVPPWLFGGIFSIAAALTSYLIRYKHD